MTKYRIVEVKFPELTTTDGTVNYVPIIYYRYEYHVEYLEEVLFGLIKRWNKLARFNTLERAEKQIEFYHERESCKVVKQY